MTTAASTTRGPTSLQAPPGAPGPGRLRRTGRAVNQYAGVLVVLAVLVVVLGATQPQFLTGNNLLIILETNAVLLVVAIGLNACWVSRMGASVVRSGLPAASDGQPFRK